MNGPSLIPKSPLVQVPVRPHNNHLLRWVGIGIVVVLVMAGGYIAARIFWLAPLEYAHNEARLFSSMPDELRTATFLRESEKGTLQYVIQGSSYDERPLAGTLISADARNANAKIIKTGAGEYAVFADNTLLVSSSVRKAGVARSGDGRFVAFAHASTTYTPENAVDPATWVITVIDTVTKSQREIGVGVSPLFVDAIHLERITASGIVEYDLVAGTDSPIVPTVFGTGSVHVLASPNRQLLGWIDESARTIQVYRVFGGSMGLVATIPIESGVQGYALGNESLYTLRTTGVGSTVWQQRLGAKAERVLTVPPSVGATRLLIGSI